MMFTNAKLPNEVVELLKVNEEVGVKVSGPKEYVKYFDIPKDTFSLNKMVEMQAQAFEMCEKSWKK
jgi:hypothetical protein